MPRDVGYFGLDIGTSSTKAVLVDRHGAIIRSASREHAVDRPGPGQVEMDPAVWWEEFTSLATELTADQRVEVAAVGVSGMGPCALVTDAAGHPLRPAILYGVDSRATQQISDLNHELGEQQIFDRCGTYLSSQATGPKLRWIAQHEPAVWHAARRLFMPASWLVFRLTGEYVLDFHSASQCTPMLDRERMTWLDDWIPQISGHLQLPRLQWPGDIAGKTARPVGGIPAGTPVITGTIDAWSEAVSVDAQRPGDLMLMYGTTMFLIATSTKRVTHPRMWGTIGATRGTFNLAGGMATTGAVASWFSEMTGADHAQLLREAEESAAGANGLVVLPYFAGERTPILDPHARGVIAGLTLTHTRGDLYRAILEGTAFGVRHNVELIRASGVVIDRVIAVGGGTQGGLWTQIVSDVTGLTQVIPSITIGASYGAAALAAGTQQDFDMSRWNPPAMQRTPRTSSRATYDPMYQAYLDLYPATKKVVHSLAALQHQG